MAIDLAQELFVTHKGKQFPIHISIEDRYNTTASIRARVVNIRVPSFMDEKDREEEIYKMLRWVDKELLKNPKLLSCEPLPKYEDGQSLNIGEYEFILHLKLVDRKSSRAKWKNNHLYLELRKQLKAEIREKHIRHLISRLLADIFHAEVKARLEYWNNNFFQKEVKGLFLKLNYSNWGSCSSDKNINLSTRLLLAPQWVMDYVIVHELAHLVHMDHSPRFWKLVKTVFPKTEAAENWLDKHGHKLQF